MLLRVKKQENCIIPHNFPFENTNSSLQILLIQTYHDQKRRFYTRHNAWVPFKRKEYDFGGVLLGGEALANAPIKIPLKTLNRHGLIAGATGTGKTKTIQVLS